MAPILSLRNLEQYYNTTPALHIQSLDFEPGRIYSLVGPNGCGKSTLLQILALLLKPTCGEMIFEDAPVVWNRHGLQQARRRITIVHQSPYLFDRTVKYNLAYGLKLRGIRGEEQQRRIHETLDLVGLAGFARRRARELSGGEQQRVALARASVNEPAIMLADEPTGNLDTRTGREILDLIKAMNAEGRTFLITTHDRAVAEAVADRIITIVDGAIAHIEQGGTR